MALKEYFQNNRLFSDSLWSLFGNSIGKGLSLVGGIIIARLLGKEVFGEYGMIKNTILSLSILSTLGLGYTSTKFIADFKYHKKEMLIPFIRLSLKITLIVCFFIALSVFVFSGFIAETFLKAPNLAYGLKVCSVLIIFNGLVANQVGIISGLGIFKELAKINILSGFILFLITLVCTLVLGFEGALLSLLISQICNFVLNKYAIDKYCDREKLISDITYDKSFYKEVISFSIPIAIQEIVFSLTMWLSSYLIIVYGTYGDLGLYNAAIQWGNIVLFIPSILRNVILSHLSSNNESSKHYKIIKQTVSLNVIVTSLVCIIVYFLSNYIELSYGNNYKGVGHLVVISCFTAIFSSISNVYAQAYMSKGKNWIMFFIRLVRDFGVLLLFVVAVKTLLFDISTLMIYCFLIINIIFVGLMVIIYKLHILKKHYNECNS